MESFGNTIEIALAKPDIRFGAEIGGTGLVASDGEYLPVVKVAPVYPMRALQRRLEGYVVVEFVVTASGNVRDVVVVESSEPVFEQAAIDAAMKFRYKPRIVDGEPVAVAGVQNRITFKLNA
jgi:protein TonB